MDTGGHHTYFHRAPSLNMPPSARGPFFSTNARMLPAFLCGTTAKKRSVRTRRKARRCICRGSWRNAASAPHGEPSQHTGHKAGKQRFRHAYARLSRRFQAFAALCAACLRHLRSSDTALLLKGAFALQKCRSLTPPPFCLRISLKSGGALPLAVLNVSSGFFFDRTTVRNGSARPPARILHNFSEALHLCRAEERRALFRPCPHGKDVKALREALRLPLRSAASEVRQALHIHTPPFPPGRAEGTLSTRSAYPALRGGKLPHSAFL